MSGLVHVPCFYKKKLSKELIQRIKKTCSKKCFVLTTIQYAKQAKELCEKEKNLVYKGIVLGCKAPRLERGCVVYLGTGEFHPIKIQQENPNSKVIIANPLTNQVRKLNPGVVEKIKRKKIIRFSKVMNARTIGILISIKKGQHNYGVGVRVKKILESKGKKAYLFLGDEIRDNALMDFLGVDAWINTACPRIIEDEFSKPVINAIDFLEQEGVESID